MLTRHGQCRPSPPVLTSRRVSHPPANARTARRLRPDPTPPLEAIYHSPFTRVTRLLEGRVCDRPACAVTPRLDIFFPSRSESSLGGTTRDGAVEGPVRSASRAVDRSFRRRTDADRGRPEPPGAENDTDPSDSQIFTERADKERPAAFLLIRPFPPTPPAPSLQSSRGVRPRPTPAAAPRSPPG